MTFILHFFQYIINNIIYQQCDFIKYNDNKYKECVKKVVKIIIEKYKNNNYE